MKKETPDVPKVSKTCRVELEGPDITMLIGEFTLTEYPPGPQHEDFADAAFKSARASLSRLMTPAYKVVVLDGESRIPYGLTRWIKLIDRTHPEYEPKKQRIRNAA